jgi:hypothetical protein
MHSTSDSIRRFRNESVYILIRQYTELRSRIAELKGEEFLVNWISEEIPPHCLLACTRSLAPFDSGSHACASLYIFDDDLAAKQNESRSRCMGLFVCFCGWFVGLTVNVRQQGND